MLAIQVNVCYILKHLEDRKALSFRIYYTWCDIILIFKLHRRTRLTPRSSIGVATNLENMENLENSGNLKNYQNLREISGKF